MRIRVTLRYRLFNWFRAHFLKPHRHDYFITDLEQLIERMGDFTKAELEAYKIMNTWTKNPDVLNIQYANTVATAMEILRECRVRYIAVANKLYLGLAEGVDLHHEMTEITIKARAVLSDIRYVHQDDQSTENTSRDSTESSESTSAQVRQVPTPGN